MPNYIANRIELSGNSPDVESLITAYSTFFERKPSKTHDDELSIYEKDQYFGWLNPITNIFSRRGQEDVIGVPEGFVQKFDEAWTRFPDFNKIVPMPPDLEISSGSLGDMAHRLLFGTVTQKFFPLSVQEEQKRFREMSVEYQHQAVDLAIKYQQNLEKYGATTWYDWSLANWGVKWNCGSCEKVSDNVYDFETAWSGVPNLIKLMSLAHPNVSIMYKYSDEDTGSNCGIGEYKNGEASLTVLKNGSKEAYELAFELRPNRKEGYQLVGDKYEYVEES